MSTTDDDLEIGLAAIAEEIVRLCSNFYKATGHKVSGINLYRDAAGNLGADCEVILSASATLLLKGAMDS